MADSSHMRSRNAGVSSLERAMVLAAKWPRTGADRTVESRERAKKLHVSVSRDSGNEILPGGGAGQWGGVLKT